jgi:hypothetical protein
VRVTLRIAGRRKALKLKTVAVASAAGRSTALKLAVGSRATKALKRHSKVTAVLSVTATGPAGAASATRTVRLAF